MPDQPTTGRPERLLEIVTGALECAPAARGPFLDRACGGDAALRAEAESLLALDEPARGFIARPAIAAHAEAFLGALAARMQPGQTLSEFRIVSLLGEGGMGEVYLADNPRLERRVALKLLKQQVGDDALLTRFRHERRVLAGLTHPNIARLYDAAVTPDGRSYLVTEYVEGERQDKYCDERALGVTARLELFRKVCAAVAHAHQNLVVHRDLKPANIRVTAAGEPKLLDFGIAKLLEPETTLTGDETLTMVGAFTPGYASPEQVRGEPITTASDVYSLGVILYELLTGQRPYPTNQRRPDEVARAICEQAPPVPARLPARPQPASAANLPPACVVVSQATWTTSWRWPCARNPRDGTPG